MQSQCSAGRIKPSIRTLIAEKQKQMYTMEAVLSEGVTHTDPATIHTLLTDNFTTWYESPPGLDACLISQPETHWSQLDESKEAFRERHAAWNIPDECIGIISYVHDGQLSTNGKIAATLCRRLLSSGWQLPFLRRTL